MGVCWNILTSKILVNLCTFFSPTFPYLRSNMYLPEAQTISSYVYIGLPSIVYHLDTDTSEVRLNLQQPIISTLFLATYWLDRISGRKYEMLARGLKLSVLNCCTLAFPIGWGVKRSHIWTALLSIQNVECISIFSQLQFSVRLCLSTLLKLYTLKLAKCTYFEYFLIL